jgi:hypothetical protein
MKVSQHITAGALTDHWISYDGTFQLSFGSDEISFVVSEDQLRSLSKRLTERIQDIEDRRIEKQDAEKKEEQDLELV